MNGYKLVVYCFILVGIIACNQKKSSVEERIENNADNTTVRSSYLVSGNRAGIFQLGETIPSADSLEGYSITKEKQIRYPEGGPVEETIYKISKDDTDLLILKPDYHQQSNGSTDIIGEMMIISDKFHTAEGIGIGSTIKKFKNEFKNINIWYTYVSDRYVMEAEAYPSIQFLLDKKDFTGELTINDTMTELKADDFISDASIIKIRIF